MDGDNSHNIDVVKDRLLQRGQSKLLKLSLCILQVHVEGSWITVDKNRDRAHVTNNFRRRSESHRRHKHAVAAPDSESLQSQMKRRSTRIDSDGISAVNSSGKLLFEAANPWTTCQPARLERRKNFSDLLFSNRRSQKGHVKRSH